MKFNFVKLLESGGNILKFQTGGISDINKPMITLNDITRNNRLNLKLGWSGASNEWLTEDGQYDFEKMYQDYLQHKSDFKSLDTITANPVWTNAKVNQLGFKDWNKQYNDTGLNKYFGYSDQQADYYGPTTAARKAFYDYIKLRESQFPNELPEVTVTPVVQPAADQLSNTTPEVQDNSEQNENGNPYEFKPAEFPNVQLPESPKREPWSDWLPFSVNLASELISADRQAALKKKLRFPLKEVPFLQHAVTNDYHLRTDLQQQANELRTLGQYRSNSSDLTQNLRNMQQYDVKASEIENQAEQHKADTFAKESQISEQVANLNKITGVEGANFNMQQNANAWNNIVEANAQRDLRRTKAFLDFVDKMTTSHGQYVLDNKLNDQQYIRGLNEYQASLDQQNFYNDYVKAVNADYKESQAYDQFLSDVENAGEGPGRNGIVLPSGTARLENPETKDAYLQELWNGEFGRKYREQLDKEKLEAQNRYLMAMLAIQNRLLASNLAIKARLNNLGVYTRPDYSSTYIPVYGYARGGSVRARYIDYQNHINKLQQFSSKGSLDRQKVREKRLATDLDRISKEQMILLRSIFK